MAVPVSCSVVSFWSSSSQNLSVIPTDLETSRTLIQRGDIEVETKIGPVKGIPDRFELVKRFLAQVQVGVVTQYVSFCGLFL